MKDGEHSSILNATSRARLMFMLRDLSRSPEGLRAKLLFAALLGGLLLINALNVASSYIGRDFMTAVASRHSADFARETVRYIGILLACTFAATFVRWLEERLVLLWRSFLTLRFVDRYVGRHLYHRLGIANPDQRIADDVKAFTQTTLSFILLIVNAAMSIVAFAGVLWTISPTLFVVAVIYATVGSAVTFWLGRPLIWINYSQFDREAEFRADLVQLRENSEFVALAHHEDHFRRRLHERVNRLISNYRRLIAVNRNVNLLTNGYNYFIPVIPVLVVAPMYMRGEVEFGVITQSTIAFAQLLGGFSLFVTQVQSISSFTAVVARLNHLSEATLELEKTRACPIEVVDGDDGLVFEKLTLEAADDRTVLVRDLDLRVERGTRLLIIGPSDMAKMALFRATGELWDHGCGRIVRPRGNSICFLPERPYLPPGTLREILLQPPAEIPRMRELAGELDLTEALERIGSLDEERDWDDILSLGELQRLALLRLLLTRPDFAFLDRLETTLEPEKLARAIALLCDAGITFVTISRGAADLPSYDQVLELGGDGSWALRAASRIAS